MIKHGPKPVVASCGCWLWCDECHGNGEVVVKKATIWVSAEMKQCDACKGNPQKLKHCPAHAKGANWEIEEKNKKC